MAIFFYVIGRSPHGERGLKLLFAIAYLISFWSLPAWGAWIEIVFRLDLLGPFGVAPRMGSVD